MTLLVVGLTVFVFGVYQVAKGGTCSSGGVHVSTKQCAAGSSEWMFALPVILLAGLGGLWLWTRRGPRPGTAPVAAQGWSHLSSGPTVRYVSGDAPGTRTDPIVRLGQLRALRDAGVLTAAEFDDAKAKILSEL